MKKNTTSLVGAHMSIKNGFAQTILNTIHIGGNCLQLFTKSNQQWHAKIISKEQIEHFHQAQWENPEIKSIIAHASYLINLCSEDISIQKKSIEALSIELERCSDLNIPYLVLHPGSRGSLDLEEAIKLTAKNIDEALEKTTKSVSVLIENTSGQGKTIGSSLEELQGIGSYIKNKSLMGYCFDTCHAFAAGYDFRSQESYKNLCENIEKWIGKKNIKAIHLNDSKKGLHSKIDRHENIGDGYIGLKGFEFIMKDEDFAQVPKIIETPKDDAFQNDIKNIRTLKSLMNNY